MQWTIAALNSIEMVTVPWWFLKITGGENDDLTGWMSKRLDQLERVLSEREWLAAGRFTVADLLMADVLRVSAVALIRRPPATEAYVTASPIVPHSRRLEPTSSLISRRGTGESKGGLSCAEPHR